MRVLYILLFLLTPNFMLLTATAQEQKCSADDKACLLLLLEGETAKIEEEKWRDQTYRELAKLLTLERQSEKAISLLDKIKNPDTKAMIIRGIGMAAADVALAKEEYDSLFATLTEEAKKIIHPPSHAIALTYIAMAQALAGDDEGAMATARSMENVSLRRKAFGETAEIQAEHGDLHAAQASLKAIDTLSYRNKAHRTVSKIFANRSQYEEALEIAMAIENNYQRSQAILYILVQQITLDEVSIK